MSLSHWKRMMSRNIIVQNITYIRIIRCCKKSRKFIQYFELPAITRKQFVYRFRENKIYNIYNNRHVKLHILLMGDLFGSLNNNIVFEICSAKKDTYNIYLYSYRKCVSIFLFEFSIVVIIKKKKMKCNFTICTYLYNNIIIISVNGCHLRQVGFQPNNLLFVYIFFPVHVCPLLRSRFTPRLVGAGSDQRSRYAKIIFI